MTPINRITSNPQILGGKPCIRNTRMTVSTIVGLFATGRSQQEILQAYPYLEPEDVQTALLIKTTTHESGTAFSETLPLTN